MANAAINGLGRIGRATLKIIFDTLELDLVAVNHMAAPASVTGNEARLRLLFNKKSSKTCHEFMNLHRPYGDALRLRRAIERWENEGGQILVKGKEVAGPSQGPAQHKAPACRARSPTSAPNKSLGTGDCSEN